jgi:hypothetical protein
VALLSVLFSNARGAIGRDLTSASTPPPLVPTDSLGERYRLGKMSIISMVTLSRVYQRHPQTPDHR